MLANTTQIGRLIFNSGGTTQADRLEIGIIESKGTDVYLSDDTRTREVSGKEAKDFAALCRNPFPRHDCAIQAHVSMQPFLPPKSLLELSVRRRPPIETLTMGFMLEVR